MITVFLYDIQKSKDTIFMLFIKIIMNIIKKIRFLFYIRNFYRNFLFMLYKYYHINIIYILFFHFLFRFKQRKVLMIINNEYKRKLEHKDYHSFIIFIRKSGEYLNFLTNRSLKPKYITKAVYLIGSTSIASFAGYEDFGDVRRVITLTRLSANQ